MNYKSKVDKLYKYKQVTNKVKKATLQHNKDKKDLN